jgi:hypothetical protein
MNTNQNPIPQTVEVLRAELARLQESYRLATANASRLAADYAGRKPSTHFGHNLSAIASELSVLAGQIETTEAMLRYFGQEVK